MSHRQIDRKKLPILPLLLMSLSLLATPTQAQQGGVNCAGCGATDGSGVIWVSEGDCDGMAFTLLVDVQDGACLQNGPRHCHKDPCSYTWQLEWDGALPGSRVVVHTHPLPNGSHVATVDEDGHGFTDLGSFFSLPCDSDKEVHASINCGTQEDSDDPDTIELELPERIDAWATGDCSACPLKAVARAASPPLFDSEAFFLGSDPVDETALSAPTTLQPLEARRSPQLATPRKVSPWSEIEGEVYDQLIMSPEKQDRFKRLHTRWPAVPDVEWIADYLEVAATSLGPVEMSRLGEVANQYAPAIESAVERYTQDYQRRLIEKLESRQFLAVPRTAGPLNRPAERSFSSLTLACRGWGIAISMTPESDPLLWRERQDLRALTKARRLECRQILGVE